MNVRFKQVLHHPVDLYYLMDLSKSMEDEKAKLDQLGSDLANIKRRITNNLRLGFGSFCTGCAASYAFRNHMQLDTDASNFSSKVAATQISGNLRAPEGGFDAIMQAIVCKNQIGWREKSNKILVLSTNSGFHHSGERNLGRIVRPNDGKCHLDRSGLYTESITQNYPSISQINHKVQEHRVNVIFAVTANQFDIYK